MSFKIRRNIPRDVLRTSILNQLNSQGRTIQELGIADIQGKAEQKPYRDRDAWHTLDELKELVAEEMNIGSELFGPNRRNDDFNRKITDTLCELRKKGLVSEWNSSKWKLGLRLAEPDSHKIIQIKTPELTRTPPKYEKNGSIRFGEEEDMKRVFVAIMERGGKDNTYKFALAKIILDYCRDNTSHIIQYDYLASKFLEHYWYQEYKYKMKQDFKTERKPMVINIIREVFGDDPPADFGRLNKQDIKIAKEKILKKVFGHARKKTSLVVPRFQNIPGNDGDTEEYGIFYSYDDDRQVICLRPEALDFFKRNHPILSRATIAKWARFLERINGSLPYLVSKIEVPELERGSLVEYHRMLSKYEDCCFYCQNHLERNHTHVDHFIPWSYIFSNDPWNLVLVCDACNLKKSDRLAHTKFKDMLVYRNEKYYNKIKKLQQSIDILDSKRGWQTEIDNHYMTCLTYGFGCISLP